MHNQKKAGDKIDVRVVLRCTECATDKMHVGLSTEGALAMICPNCNNVVMYLEKWPDESQMPANEECCGSCHRTDLN